MFFFLTPKHDSFSWDAPAGVDILCDKGTALGGTQLKGICGTIVHGELGNWEMRARTVCGPISGTVTVLFDIIVRRNLLTQ